MDQEDLNYYISKIKHEIDEVALRALKTIHLKTLKTLKFEKCRTVADNATHLHIRYTANFGPCYSFLYRCSFYWK